MAQPVKQAPPTVSFKLSPRRVFLGTVVVTLVGLAFWGFIRFGYVFLVLFLGIVLSLAIRPAVAWLSRYNVPRGPGVAIVYLVLLALLVGFILLLAPLLADQLTALAGNLPGYYREFRATLLNSNNLLLWRLGLELPPTLTFLPPVDPVDEESVTTVAQAWEYATVVLRAIFLGLAVLLVGFYWTLDGERMTRSVLLLMPQGWRDGARDLLTAVEIKVGAYISGQIVLCLFIAGMNLIAFVLIGLPYPLLLALIAGVFEILPMIGPVLGAVPAVLLALSLGEPTMALWVVGATIVIQQFENAVLVPRIMRRAVGVNPLVTILALLAFSSVLGIVGAIIAVPIAAIAQLLLNRFLLTTGETGHHEEITGRDYASRLRYEVQQLTQDVRKQVRDKNAELYDDIDMIDMVEDEIEKIATELDALLVDAGLVEAEAEGLP